MANSGANTNASSERAGTGDEVAQEGVRSGEMGSQRVDMDISGGQTQGEMDGGLNMTPTPSLTPAQTPTAMLRTPGVSSQDRAGTDGTGNQRNTPNTPGSVRQRRFSRSRSLSRSIDLSGMPLTPMSGRTPQRTPRSDMGHTHSGNNPSILFRRRRERENSMTPGLTPEPNRTRPNANSQERERSTYHTPSISAGSLEAQDDPLLMEEPETTFVWGTNVNIFEAQTRFRRFISNFEAKRNEMIDDETEVDSDTPAAKYPTILLDTIRRGENSIDLNCADLYEYDEELYSQLVAYPQEIVPLFDIVVNDIAVNLVQQDDVLRDEYFPRGASQQDIEPLMFKLQVRTYNLKDTKTMRGLDPSDVDHLVSVKGMVTHVSSILPDLKQAFFKCSVCGFTPEPVYIDRGNIQEPQKCQNCSSLNSMVILHNRCLFSNKQQVKMQETPDTVPEGETPCTMSTYVFDDHVDAIKPGDRLKISGIFRALPVRVASRQRSLRSVFKTYVDVIHVDKDDPNDTASFLQSKTGNVRSGLDTEADDREALISYTPQEEAAFKRLSESPDIYGRLVKSLAPSVWELDDVKRGILCQLFSGSSKTLKTGERLRAEVNVLLCGDPGTSKSQLMSYVHKLSPRGIYTSGRGSSSVGLTAYVARDPETRELVLESGALVLSDLGVCCIDEFDKMSDDARNALHEAMEQQTVSLAKAGIICTLNARTSVLASANPAGSRYNPAQSVVENLRLPSTLLSRFDLIFLILDKPDLAADRQLARHLVSLHNPDEAQNDENATSGIIPVELLRAYILYAQSKCRPVISDAAAEQLVNIYVDMRRLGSTTRGNKVITSTPRQLESLVRLSEALAKMRLSQTVEVEDVDEAARLVKVALQQSATDPRTGTIDMDLIQTGVASSLRQMRQRVEQDIRSILSSKSGRSLPSTELMHELKEKLSSSAPTPNELWEVLQQMSESGRLHIRGDSLSLA